MKFYKSDESGSYYFIIKGIGLCQKPMSIKDSVVDFDDNEYCVVEYENIDDENKKMCKKIEILLNN